jgi:hypothetical protein
MSLELSVTPNQHNQSRMSQSLHKAAWFNGEEPLSPVQLLISLLRSVRGSHSLHSCLKARRKGVGSPGEGAPLFQSKDNYSPGLFSEEVHPLSSLSFHCSSMVYETAGPTLSVLTWKTQLVHTASTHS